MMIPVGLVFCSVMPKTQQDRSVEALYLAIGLGAMCTRVQAFSSQMESKWHQKLGQNLWSVFS